MLRTSDGTVTAATAAHRALIVATEAACGDAKFIDGRGRIGGDIAEFVWDLRGSGTAHATANAAKER